MNNNEKIKEAERLIAEANKLIAEVKNSNDDENIHAGYINAFTMQNRLFYIDSDGYIDYGTNNSSFADTDSYPYGYYPTLELAEQAKAMKDFNDKLLAFKYCYDADYKPNWNDHVGNKFFVCYKHIDEGKGKYMVDYHYVTQVESIVYFSTKEIAQKCADWLNSLKWE